MIATFRTLLVVACAAGASACGSDSTASSTTTAPAEQRVAPQPAPPAAEPLAPIVTFTTPPPAYNGALPPLPQVPYALPRSPEVVQAVYTFAARHPEVLHYVPCFCGCQRSGHNNNDDCFIKRRDSRGRPEWDAHGMG
jgi:hypothetical protein